MTLKQRLKYFSVCSGIEAATVAWHEFMDAVAFVERDQFPSAVLAHHYPAVPNLGDLTKWREWSLDLLVEADVLVGGTPCQAFSVAGLRKSLDDDRGNLSLEFVRLADAIDDVRLRAGRPPAVILWENVPGVFSVNDNAFGCFLAALAGDVAPYDPPGGKWTDAGVVDGPQRSVAWRVLDAQYFGLAQRRRRVFVVASPRDRADPSAILLEWESLRRDHPPSREAGQGASHDTAPCLTGSGRGVKNIGETRGKDPVIAVDVVGSLSARMGRNGGGANDEVLQGRLIAFGGNNTAGEIEVAPAVNANRGCHNPGDFEAGTLLLQSDDAIAEHMAVRRLTPVECERLQGFPDNYTAIPWRGKDAPDCPDGPRYKALGNSMAVPVMRWIGQRIVKHIMEEVSNG